MPDTVEPTAVSGSTSVAVPPAELPATVSTELRAADVRPVLPPLISLLRTSTGSARSYSDGMLPTGKC